jgi:hypothetical protein
MAIAPISFFTHTTQAQAAQLQAATATTNAAATAATAATTATNQTTLATFSAVLGQVLAQLGPLAIDTTLTNIGNANANNTGGVVGLSNTVFSLLLLNTLGLGQGTGTGTGTQSAAVQQLLVAQLLVSSTGTTNALGLDSIAEEQLGAALAQQGTNSTFQAQLAAASTQPNPIAFSSAALAQAFQIGNGTGLPA